MNRPDPDPLRPPNTWVYAPDCRHSQPDEFGECFFCGELIPNDYEPRFDAPYTLTRKPGVSSGVLTWVIAIVTVVLAVLVLTSMRAASRAQESPKGGTDAVDARGQVQPRAILESGSSCRIVFGVAGSTVPSGVRRPALPATGVASPSTRLDANSWTDTARSGRLSSLRQSGLYRPSAPVSRNVAAKRAGRVCEGPPSTPRRTPEPGGQADAGQGQADPCPRSEGFVAAGDCSAVRRVPPARDADRQSDPLGDSRLDTSWTTGVQGIASWYCLPGRSRCTRGLAASGAHAAAGPALRVGDWRGRIVTVSSGGRSIRVRLSDWCACPGKVIDLYASQFQRLAPLSRGLIRVSVSWDGAGATLPPTDSEGEP